MKTRLVHEIGTRINLRIYWGGECKAGGYHNALQFIEDTDLKVEDLRHLKEEDYPNDLWPTHCQDCGATVPTPPEEFHRHVFKRTIYNTESGQPEPGDLYFDKHLPEKMYWDNHQGPMLIAILPDGTQWNIDSRASNCGSPHDRLHRCWVRHGQPPDITVDKIGVTCNAGAGSIMSHTGKYHGFLRNGQFTDG